MCNTLINSFAKDAKIFFKLVLVLDNSFIVDINENKLFEMFLQSLQGWANKV